MLSLLFLASLTAPAPQYGPPPPLPTGPPERLVAPTPSVVCTVTYVTLWDTQYQESEEQVRRFAFSTFY